MGGWVGGLDRGERGGSNALLWVGGKRRRKEGGWAGGGWVGGWVSYVQHTKDAFSIHSSLVLQEVEGL